MDSTDCDTDVDGDTISHANRHSDRYGDSLTHANGHKHAHRVTDAIVHSRALSAHTLDREGLSAVMNLGLADTRGRQ
jgi:hypothetical protein